MSAKWKLFKSAGKIAISAVFILSTILTPLVPVAAATSVTPEDPLSSLDEAMDSVSDAFSQSNFTHVEETEGASIQEADPDEGLEGVVLHLETTRAFVVPGRRVEIHWSLEGWEDIGGMEGLTLLFLLPKALTLSEDELGEFDQGTHSYELAVTSPEGYLLCSIQRGAEGPFHIQAAVLKEDLVLAETRLTLESILGLSSLHPIRSQGSQLKALGGRVQVEFPQGAVRETLITRVYDVRDGGILPFQQGERIDKRLGRQGIPSLGGKPFEILAFSLFGKQVTHFDQSVEIQIQYEDDEVQGDEESLTLFTFDEKENTWVPLPSMVDTENNILTGWTDHFSLFDFNVQDWEAARLPSVAGFQVSTFTGAATYSYPIQVPPGPGGLQPSLSLSYNSQVVDSANSRTQASWVGMGWSLETGYIQRNMKGTVFYEEDDTFTLHVNGTSNLLLPVGEGTDGVGDYIEYHPVEENFWRIRYYPEVGYGGYALDISHWEIWDGEGNHYLFNPGPSYPDYRDYRIDLMRRWQWPLTRVTNRFGQSLTYSYETEYKVTRRCTDCDQAYHQAAVYPSTITYPNDRYRIRFVRTARDDYENKWVDSKTSFILFQRSLLSELLVEHDSDGDGNFEQVIRKYVFTYETDPEKLVFPNVSWSAGGKTPTLAQIQELGLNGESLPPTTFEYGDNMHLTRGENGYGGVVEFQYDTWNGDESSDEGELTGWSPPHTLYQDEMGIPALDKDVYYPGAVYAFTARVNSYKERWVQFGLDDGSTEHWGEQVPVGHPETDWKWEEFSATIMLPPTASRALPMFGCSFCSISTNRMTLLPTRYRVTEKRVYDGFDPSPAVFLYGYEGAAMNDSDHSDAASTSEPYFKAHTEFRGHARAWEQDPGGAIRTTWFHQDDLLKGRSLRTQVTDTDGDVYLETETQYAIDPQSLGTLPKKENGTVYTGFSINWIRTLESVSRTYEGDETWVGTRVEYGYDSSLQGLRQFGNLTHVHEYAWDGSSWSLYRSSHTRYYPNTWYGRYLVGLPARTMTFDASGNMLYETRYHYDGNTSYSALPTSGILTAQRQWMDSKGGSRRYRDESYDYDSWGNPSSVTSYTGYGTESALATSGAQGAWTTYDDAYHTYAVEIRNELNHLTSVDYDFALGLPIRETDPNGATITATYDGLGRFKSLRRPGDESGTPTVEIAYTDSLPYVVEIRQKQDRSSTQVSQRYYDGLGQLIQTQTVGAQLEEGLRDIVVDYVYDKNGRVVQETVPYALPAWGGYRGQQLTQPSVQTSYDFLGRATRVAATDGSLETILYDDLEIHTTDARGNTTTQVSDVWSRTVQVIPATGPGVRYIYDELDRLIQVIKGSGGSATNITMAYDNAGRKLGINDPDMGHWIYSYDALGNLITQTDARGETLWFAYDDLNRLEIKRKGDARGDLLVRYGYDEGNNAIGRRTSMEDATGSTTWTYDIRGRLEEEIKHITGAGTFLTRWSYNAADMITSMTYPGGNEGQPGEQVNYGYHPQGALDSLSSSEGNYLQSSGYDAAGRLVSRTLGNDLLRLDYDFYPWTTVNGQGRLKQINSSTSDGLVTFQDLRYAYYPNGNIKQIEDWIAGPPQTQAFDYDELNRLLSAEVTGGTEGLYSESYAYDPATGNLREKGGVAYVYDPNHPHAVTHLDGEQRFWYDANGGMVHRVVDAYHTQSLYYDIDNRLIGVDIEEVIPEPTSTASSTPTETPTATLTETPTSTPEGGETPTSASESTSTSLPEPSNTPTPSLEPSHTPEPSLTFTPTETSTPTVTFTPTGTPTPPYNQITVGDDVSTHQECDWNVNFNYTVEDGQDRLLVVSFVHRRDNHQGVWGASYDGIGMHLAASASDPGGDHAIAYIYYLENPPAGTHNVNIGLNTACIIASAITLYGVDLTDPLVITGTEGWNRTSTSLTLASNPGDMAVDVVGADGSGGLGQGQNQIERWEDVKKGSDWYMKAAGSTEGSQGSRVMMSYNLLYNRDFAHAAAVFRARQGPRPTSTPVPTNTYTPLPTSTPTITSTPTSTPTLSDTPEGGSGLVGEYYDNMDLSYLKVVRTDPTVNFDWGSGSPDPSLGSDTYSIRWTGRVRASYSETYTFYVRSDDGARLWVDGQLIIDQWSDHAAAEYSGSVALSASQLYDIRLEYYENTQGAIVELRWSSPNQAKEIVPQSALYSPNPPLTPTGTPADGSGLGGQYYNNADLTDLKLTRADSAIDFDWGNGSPDASIGADTFSVRWVGKILPRFSETHTFYVRSDDGARLWVDGQLIIDQWTDHGPVEYAGSIPLTAGVLYDITLEYYENGIGAIVQLSWSSRTQAKQIIPQSQLFPAEFEFTPSVTPSPTSTPTPLPTSTSAPTPTSTKAPFQVDFNNYEIVPYGGNQDLDPIMTIEEDGQTLHLVGNAWKKISLPYSVTENTLLTFDFKSSARGEVHGIGFDDDDVQNEERTFKLYGTQIWGEFTYDSYAAFAPEWKHYTIAIGQFYTGEMDFLFFVNDHDVADPDAESFFRNIQIYETDGSIPTLEPTATTTGNYMPDGWLDAANEEYIAGWAKDDDVAGPIWIHFYVDGRLVLADLADSYREDVGEHAFHWVHPDWGPGTHEVRVYAFSVDPSGNPDGQDMELNGSPKFYDVPDPTATPTATATEPPPTPIEPLPPTPHDANFYYDGDGNRVMSIVDGVAKVYLGDYYEYEVGTGITRSYYGSGSAMRVAGASDPEANGVFYLLKDHLGSTNLTIDSAGNVVGEMRYKAWGETRYTSGTTPTDFNYTSQRQEPDLGFYYYRARWYDPALGRFMQADTIVPHPGSPQSLDRYAYVLNNPLKYFDPSGHQDEDDPPWDPFGWLKDIYRGFSNWWNGLMRDMCSMNLDPNCGMMLPSLPSAPDAIEQVASNYADHSWGGISQEQIEQIHAISDATSRLIVIQEILGPWKVNEVGEPFPVVIDPRTGKPIPPPPDDLQVVPEELRVSWDGRQDRREYIEEWYDQGYETPPGGWDLYQIHHIKPIRYGGTNEFDNLVPVLIEDHRGSGGFNAWWNNYRSSR